MGFCVALITMVSDVSQILMNLSSRPVRQANNTFFTLQPVKGEQRPWEIPMTRGRIGEQSLELQVPRFAKQDFILMDLIFLPAEGLTDCVLPQSQLLCSAPTQGRHPGLVQETHCPAISSCSLSHISTCLT